MIEITPVNTIDAQIEVPGSKSLTQRALIAAALASGKSELIGPLSSEDTHYTISALRSMGINIDDHDPDHWVVNGTGGVIRQSQPRQDIFLGNNGTATRFLTSVAALGHGDFRITGDERMSERPIAPLMKALHGWDASISCEKVVDCPPLFIKASGLSGGKTTLPEGKSSQYLSSLLLVAPYAKKEAELEVDGVVLSRPYVEMTLAVMSSFGIHVEAAMDLKSFLIPKGIYKGQRYKIEGDASGASYFWAAAAISGGRVTVSNVPVPSLQGDAGLVPLLARMGCEVTKQGDGITVQGPEQLTGIEVDMGNMPDVAPTLAVVAAFAKGKSIIYNIEHLRIKECDRLSAMVTELGKMGVTVEEEQDRMIIHGSSGGENLHGAAIETYNDHRIAMCFGVAGLRVAGVKVHGEECVVKSFPDFWQRFAKLAA